MQDNRNNNTSKSGYVDLGAAQEAHTENASNNTGNRFDAIGMSGGVFDINVGASSSEMNYLNDLATNLIEENRGALQKSTADVRVHRISGKMNDPSAILKCDVVAISATSQHKTTVRAMLVIQAGTMYDPLTYNDGGHTLNVDRYDSDQDDDVLRNDVRNRVAKAIGEDPSTVQVMKSMRMPKNHVYEEKNDSAGRSIIIKVLQGIVIDLVVDRLGLMADFKLVDIDTVNGAGVEIRMSRLNPKNNIVRYDGSIINPSIELDISALYNKQKISNKSVHGGSEVGEHVAKVRVRTAVKYSPGNIDQSLGGGYGGIHRETQCWQPQMIIEDIDMPSQPSMSRLLLVLACSTSLYNKELLESAYGDDIGALNLRCNLRGDKVAKVIPRSDVSANFRAIFSQMFSPNILLSMVIRQGDISFALNSKWLDSLGQSTSYAHSVIEHFAGIPVGELKMGNVINSMVDIEPVGTWQDDSGDEHPLSSIGELYLLNNFGSQTQLIKQWIDAGSGNLDPRLRLSRKLEIISKVTKNRFEVTDKQILVTFNPALATMLRDRMVSLGIQIQTNSALLNGATDEGWGAYLASNSGFTVGSGSNPFVSGNFGNNNSGGGHIPPTIT